MARSRLFLVSAAFILSSWSTFGQPRPSPPPQTARQALIEIISGDQKALQKHLTLEVQQELSKPGGKTAAAELASLSGIARQAGSDVKSFDTGDLLLAISDPKKSEKVEVVVESDDLAGDLDTLQLSLHVYRDGNEEDDEIMAFSPRLSVEMKKQENVWRLNNLTVSVNVAVGSPKLFQKLAPQKATGVGVVAGSAGDHSDFRAEETCCTDPQMMLQLLAAAELNYAREHPQTGFTCSASELADPNHSAGQLLNQPFFKGFAGGTANGFRFAIAGCQGKPAGSYQITAEPASPNATPKAFCMDATQIIRTADDGRGATCLAAGRPVSAHESEGGMVGFSVGVPESKPQK
jgi:hypothetical protein